MKGVAARSRGVTTGQVLSFLILLGVSDWASAAIRYAIPEEARRGSAVGNVVADLKLDLGRLPDRRLRVVSGGSKKYFRVDLKSGALLVSERIDREELCGTVSPCSLSFEILVENPLELYSGVVEIQDINDNDPVFPSSQARLEISESVAPGVRFPLESAQDPDVGINSLQTYQLSANPHFVLDVQTREDGSKHAELVLEKELDREEQRELHLVLTALDGGSPPRSASVQIHIDVVDANDNAPVFNHSTYKASVRENTPSGTLVARISAYDLDDGPNGDVVYSFSSHTLAKVRELFTLDSATGELKVKGQLDYEEMKLYEIYLQAKDKGVVPGVAHCKVLVEVVDVNDNTPEVTVTSVYSPVPEDAAPGTVVALLSVTDLDSGDNGLVNCFISPGIPFTLSSSLKNYYTLKTKEALDREEASRYNITITARDLGSPPLSAVKQLLVQVSDVNDNAPKSLQDHYDVYVPENNVAGIPILNISATDPDLGPNSRLSYVLLQGDPTVSRLFSINQENGTLYLLASLDHEDQMKFSMMVQVQDGGSLPLSTNLSVSVFVTDLNDNAPVVLYPRPNSTSTDVVAPGTPARHMVTKVVAVDADLGYNAWISYTLLQATDPSLFSIGLHSGEIFTARQVQENEAPQHTLVILLKDHGEPALSASVTVTISVDEMVKEALIDLTDVAPAHDSRRQVTFYLILAVILVSVAFFITVVSVGIFKCYKWRQSKELFNSSRSTLYRTPGPFHHIDAVRGGFTPPSFYHQVYLTTDSRQSDVLCKKPFTSSPLGSRQNTMRNGEPGLYHQIVGTASRVPKPAEWVGLGGSIESRSVSKEPLVVAEELFIKPAVSKAEGFDQSGRSRKAFEHGRQLLCFFPGGILQINLSAFSYRDALILRGEAERWIRRKGKIQEVFKADGAGWQQEPQPAKAPEPLPEPRKRQPGIFSSPFPGACCVPGQDPGQMRADMVCVSLQRPAWKWQVLSLFSLCGWVSGQIRYSVFEESEAGTVVGNVAKDLGLKVEELSGRRLRLGSEESLRYFAVRLESGALVVSKQLDRERLCGAAASCVLSVQVVTENPLELFRLEVEILDLNDNSPSFPSAHRTLRISESAATAARFPLESAQDPDVGINTVGSYRLSPNSHFSLDVKQLKDGKLFPELVLERTLDREEQPELQLVLTAVDGGSPALSGTAQITVLVLDSNDNAPSFDRTIYKVRVPENTPTGALLLQLNASDPDEGPNGEVQYSFGTHTPDLVRGLFTLDPHSGEVRVSRALDFEESPFYEIHVRAHDGGVPEMEGHCVLQVEVEDANDNPPEVLLTSLLNPLPEDTPPETVVGLFNVRDRDSGANGDVSLEISPDVPFAVRSLQNHYSLVTRESLDRETTPQYAVELIARDGGSPALTTRLTLLLNISDVNDNAPRFSQPSYDAFLPENNPPGSLLCTISASDPDDGVNSRLVYSIEGGYMQDAPTSSFIHIDPASGDLYAQRTFDFELVQVLPVTVTVRDSGSPPLRANVTVYIFVLDQNDHPPRVLHPASSSEVPAPQRVPLSAPPGYLVTKVTAVDADAGHNAWLSYHLLPQSTEPSLFRVAPYTGEVRTARALRDTDVAAQQILVLVQDNGDPRLSTTVTIAVLLVEAAAEESYKPRDFLAGAKEKPDLTLYLIIALAAVSTVALATFTVLAARCVRRRGRAAGSPCCCWPSESPSRSVFKHASPKLQLSSDGTLKYMEVTLRPTDSQSQCYRTCFSPSSDRSDFTFVRPCPAPGTLVRETDSFLSATGTLTSQQAQPNTDWRFSQTQRPGTSGSQNGEEGGAWPNNQFDTEMLQAMILASANEAADGNATLGAGTGTMGLSARYGPQFTLQHVPDYRQNVYIPGSTATLGNAGGKRDAKGAGSSGGNKKKANKKEKK
ncbi:uncharacterized protein ACNFOS_007602 [Eudromia elegans]